MNVVICIIARTTSTRLPLKVLRSFDSTCSKSMLDMIIEKSKLSKLSSKVVLCTSNERCDDILDDVAARHNISIYRGEAEEVISRMLNVANAEKADYVVRITGDNAFVSAEYIDQQILFCKENNLDYCRLVGVPIGATAELIKVTALKDVFNKIDISLSEYLMLYIFDPDSYRCGLLEFEGDFSDFGITIDTEDDLKNAREIVRLLGDKAEDLSLKNICNLLIGHEYLFSRIEPNAKVKMPLDKVIDYSEFKKDQQSRIGRVSCIQKNKLQ